jgi:hypothetical protein
MSIDTKIILPHEASMEDVGNVAAKLLGCPAQRVPLSNGGFFAEDRDLAWKLYVKRTSGDADAYEAAKKQAMKNLTPSQYDRVDDLMDGFERQHREDMDNMRGYREDE